MRLKHLVAHNTRRTAAILLPAMVAAWLFSLSANAVTILDSTWRQEGGSKGHEWAGFGAHERLAAEPQFHSVLAFANDGETWGEASGTWIGNDAKHAYILTAAHIYELPASVHAYSIRSPNGRTYRPDRIWVHPDWHGDTETRTGYDLAILRLPTPLAGMGAQPVLYSGNNEAGKLITFIGFGSRGIGSTGEKKRFYREATKAAAQGVVDQWVKPIKPLPAKSDAGNYLGVFLPKEDGSIPNEYGGANKPATRLAGLLGSGDSGGSAWMALGTNWVIAAVNSNGSGTAAYGDSSWFTRIAPHKDWIRGIFPGAQFSP